MSETDLKALAAEIGSIVVQKLEALLAKPNIERAVSREQMADLLGVGVATIDRLVRDNLIPSMMPGNRRLFLPSKVFEALTVRH